MLIAEDNKIDSLRNEPPYYKVTDAAVTEIEDSSAPLGMRRQYSFSLDNIDAGDISLTFCTVHQLVTVEIDGETVYTLSSGDGIGTSPSSVWTTVPLYPSDSGRQITVTITPVYKSSLNREVEFAVGSKFDFFAERFRIDMPNIVLSMLCIFVGIVLVLTQLIMLIARKASSWDSVYLGCFSLIMGVWRVTDTRFSAMMFANNAKAIGYITIFALFILPVPLLLYIDELHGGKRRLLLRSAATATGVVAFIVLILQLFEVAELRETLVLCHIMLILDIAVSVFTVMFHSAKTDRESSAQLFVVLVGAGSLADLIYYYLRGTSSGMTTALLVFLLCAIHEFVSNIYYMNRKMYIDEQTKLYNRMRWDELVENSISDNETVGVMMLDINNLKHTNDTLGHDAGDKLITDFADILRKNIGSSEALFRWGGDEFVILVRNANSQKLADYASKIKKATEEHNNLGNIPNIHFACGYALSDDFPTLSKRELLAKADELMYEEKNRWHAKYMKK